MENKVQLIKNKLTASILKLRIWHTDTTTYSPLGCKKKKN